MLKDNVSLPEHHARPIFLLFCILLVFHISLTYFSSKSISSECTIQTNCDWPAESIYTATNLTQAGGTILNNKFYNDLSGAVWNPVTQQLWVCRGTHKDPEDSGIWAMKQNNQGRFQVEKNNKKQAQWSGFGDIEGLTLADYKESNILYLVQERQGLILEVDLSDYGSFKIQNSWNIASTMGGGDGAEAITFVPDKFLLEQNFVDSKGNLYLSKGGMGGLTLVGNQRGGYIYAYDLNRKDSTFVFVGRYMTEREDVSGLEFDRSSGLLYIWHGAQFNQLSVARLSSSLLKNEPKLETQKIYNGPGAILNEDNHEGIAITSTNECLNGKRRFFLITDHGLLWSLKMFNQFPCNKEEVLLNRSSVIL